MNLTFDTKLRVPFPQPGNLALQSFHIFNLYRAGSSVVEAAAEAFGQISGRTPNNVVRTLYATGTEFFDNNDFSKPVHWLADDGASLLRLCEVGGWINYGYREVPSGFATGFRHAGAAILIVRDPRDIGISHYHALAGHDDTNPVYGDHVRQARAATAGRSLEQYLLCDELIGFLTRICESYRPMIANGVPVVQYESLFMEGMFDIALLCDKIFDTFAAYDDGRWSREAFMANTAARIANSKVLKGHATGGTTSMFLSLPPRIRNAYTERLQTQLELLGY